jgi:hypothetical protein
MLWLLKNSRTLLIIFVLGLILLVFSLPFKEKTYVFDWDQANDFEAVETIAKGKLRLIGPRVTSDTGFFLAPWHYYYLLPFYKLTNGSLDMGFWGVVVIQYLLVVASFFLTKKWFGEVAGIAVGILIATPTDLTAWGFMYVPLLSLLFFYLCLETLKKPQFLVWLFLLFGFGCTTYAVFYALGIPFLYIIIHLIRQGKISWQKLISGIALFLLPYFPLLVFDLRHNFLNITNLLRFAGNQDGQGSQKGYFIKVFFRAIETMWLGQELQKSIALIVVLFCVIVLIVGAITLFRKEKTFVFLWLISSLVPMSLFKGNVSEYYYAPVILLIPIFISGLLIKGKVRGKILLFVLIIIIATLRFKNKVFTTPGIVLGDKIKVVNELEKIGDKYSVSYDFNLGEDSGYNFIFKKLGKNYVEDGSAQLYTITYKNGNKLPSGTKIVSTEKLSIYKR